MSRLAAVLAGVAATAGVLTGTVWASWATMSLDEKVIRADLVVLARLSLPAEAGQDHVIGTLSIERWLKGQSTRSHVRVRLGRWAADACRGDGEGVWFIRRAACGRLLYEPVHPLGLARTAGLGERELDRLLGDIAKVVSANAPREVTLAEAARLARASGTRPLPFVVSAAFAKERVTRDIMGRSVESEQWFLVDGDVRISTLPRSLGRLAEKSARSGRKLRVEVLARCHPDVDGGERVYVEILRAAP